MNFEDEILTDSEFNRYGEQRRAEYISKHCAAVELKIQSALSRADAEKIAADACRVFEETCQSSIIRNALIKRIEEVINLYWKNGNR